MSKACKKCHLIIDSPEPAKPGQPAAAPVNVCPLCQGTEFTEKFNSVALIFDAEKSEVAAKMGVKAPGRYAVKIKER
ncbi:MAG: DNA-directed RNA polymerase subunit E'' [Candidatus Micrarchaeota archaeon]|nr:DNA-directed RNA polymerase subunit E'' [Candidatus Micrarchaeota archaeon]